MINKIKNKINQFLVKSEQQIELLKKITEQQNVIAERITEQQNVIAERIAEQQNVIAAKITEQQNVIADKITEQTHQLSEKVINLEHRLNYLLDKNPRTPENLFYAVCEAAQSKTVGFIAENLKKAICITNYEEFLTYAVDNITIKGNALEFGVFTGYSINFMSSKREDMKFYGFDSFEGLPEVWEGYHSFDFNMNGNMPKVNANVTLIKGWFDQSLPIYTKEHHKNIALLHVDCDLYSSTKTIFEYLAPYIVKDTLIIFDEFFNYPNYEEHEMKAFLEFTKEHNIQYEYIAYCGERVMIKIH